jgi:DNA-binding transcriptional LysR family regulator
MSDGGRFQIGASTDQAQCGSAGGHGGGCPRDANPEQPRKMPLQTANGNRGRGCSGGSWVGVEVRHLAALEAIAAERSFHGAADRLGYVQSAVSQQLSALEALVGTRLVERSSGHSGVELTQSGMVLLEHSVRILRQLSAARADLEALSENGDQTLRVGGFQSVTTRVLPHVLFRLARQSPELDVVLTETPTDDDLFDAVAAGKLDFAFAELPLSPGPFEAIELFVDPCVLLVHRDSPLAVREHPIALTDVAAAPLTMPSWRMAELIGHHFRVLGHEPRHVFYVENDATVAALVSAGVAVGILPRLAADPPPPNTELLELEGIPARTLVLYWHRDRAKSAAMERFIRTVRAVCRELRPAEPVRAGKAEVTPIALAELAAADIPPELAA